MASTIPLDHKPALQPDAVQPNAVEAATPMMVRLRNVEKSYSAEGRIVKALDEVNLEVPRGRFLAVVGRSGCGKSTLLNLLGGLDRPTAGEVLVDNRAVHAMNEKQLTAYRRFTVGIVFQFFNLLPLLTVIENAILPALLAGQDRKTSRDRACELLQTVGLADRLDQQSSLLSGGEMQRVAVVRALINQPPLVLADEPTGNLDSRSAGPVLETLRALTAEQNTTVIMVTHSREAAAIADDLREMRDGHFVEE